MKEGVVWRGNYCLSALVFYCLLYLPSLANAAEQQEAASHLFGLINQRLAYMEDVALYKAQHGLAIEDTEREAIVIADAVRSAVRNGIEVKSAEQFFTAQINAAKIIQQRVLSIRTQAQIEQARPRNLNQEVRPALTALGDAILLDIADYLQRYGSITLNERQLFNQQISNEYLPQKQKQFLFEALSQLEIEN